MKKPALAAALAAAIIATAWPVAGGVMPGPETARRASVPGLARNMILPVGHAEVFRFGQVLGTVIVGNVAVIEASVLDARGLVLTALAPGRTNVIVMAEDGRPISRFRIETRLVPLGDATVYHATARARFSCTPRCSPLDATPAE